MLGIGILALWFRPHAKAIESSSQYHVATEADAAMYVATCKDLRLWGLAEQIGAC